MTKINKFKIIILAIVFVLPQLTQANSTVSSTIKTPDPSGDNLSWFRYSEAPGNVIQDSIILRNLGNQPTTVKVYATDALTNQAGSFTLKTNTEEQKSIGLWTNISKSEVTLQPEQSEEVPFQINIPESISPGQYFGGIVNEEITPGECGNSSKSCKGSVQIKTRSGNRVYLTIPGTVKEDIRLTEFNSYQTNKTIHFKFTFVNDGNVSFEPKATINLYNILNQKVASIDRSLGKSLPGSSITPIADWDFQGNFGPLTAKAQIFYNQDNTNNLNGLHESSLSETKSTSIFIFPWEGFMTITLILLGMATFWLIRKRLIKKMITTSVDYQVMTDDNIMKIAEAHSVKWQTIAEINQLKAPYPLSPGQIIKIPNKNV